MEITGRRGSGADRSPVLSYSSSCILARSNASSVKQLDEAVGRLLSESGSLAVCQGGLDSVYVFAWIASRSCVAKDQ